MPNDPVKIFVKNVGKTTLNQNYITVMLDGDVVADYALALSGNESTHWDPSSVLTITIDQALESGDHTVMVTTENGVSDKLSFRI
jgi:archaellum component FlaG (FlaF/FlaG flagellin family)